MTDLETYVEEVLARQSEEMEPLPQIKPYEVYAYQAGEREAKDPFRPFFEQEGAGDQPPEQCQPGVDPGCVAPDPNRNREELEFYPLDALRMVGTLERDGQTWGVVLSPEGTIHRVTVDNHLGRNHGRITDIREEAIELIEIVPSAQGGWQERPTRMALSEQ